MIYLIIFLMENLKIIMMLDIGPTDIACIAVLLISLITCLIKIKFENDLLIIIFLYVI